MGFVDKNYITIHRVNNTFFDGKEVLKMYDEVFELYAMELHSKLKDRINGRVFVKIDGCGTRLRVEIKTIGNIEWQYYSYDIMDRLWLGVPTDVYAREIVAEFKKFILGKFLK